MYDQGNQLNNIDSIILVVQILLKYLIGLTDTPISSSEGC